MGIILIAWFILGGVISSKKHYMRDNGGFVSLWYFKVWKQSIVDALLILYWGIVMEILAIYGLIFSIFIPGLRPHSNERYQNNNADTQDSDSSEIDYYSLSTQKLITLSNANDHNACMLLADLYILDNNTRAKAYSLNEKIIQMSENGNVNDIFKTIAFYSNTIYSTIDHYEDDYEKWVTELNSFFMYTDSFYKHLEKTNLDDLHSHLDYIRAFSVQKEHFINAFEMYEKKFKEDKKPATAVVLAIMYCEGIGCEIDYQKSIELMQYAIKKVYMFLIAKKL